MQEDIRPAYAYRLKTFCKLNTDNLPDWVDQRYRDAYWALRACNHAKDGRD